MTQSNSNNTQANSESKNTIEAALAANEAPTTETSNKSEPDENNIEHTAEDKNANTEPTEQKSPGIFSILQSVIAAMFGIQSDAKREADFEKGNPGIYIFVGIVMVIIFIFVIIGIVNSALEGSGIPH